MKLRTTLLALMRVVIEQAERDPQFAARLNEALMPAKHADKMKDPSQVGIGGEHPAANAERPSDVPRRSKNRRAPAVLDPVRRARVGEQALRAALEPLALEQLLDIVAEQGMDPGKLVMKWRDRRRVIDRIIELSLTRAQKGDVFRPQTDSSQNKDPTTN